MLLYELRADGCETKELRAEPNTRFTIKMDLKEFESNVNEVWLVLEIRVQNEVTRFQYKGLNAEPSSPVWRSKRTHGISIRFKLQ